MDGDFLEQVNDPETAWAALDKREFAVINARERAHKAAQVLDNEAFQEAMKALHDKLREEWATTPHTDTETLSNIRRSEIYLDFLLNNLISHMKEGKLAAKELARIEEERKWWKPYRWRRVA